MKGTFRITLPVDFGDGHVHQPGDIVELDVEQAKLYGHALIAVEPKTQGALEHGGNA